MNYKGKYKPKNPEKYQGDHTNIVYRSMWEKYCFLWCDKSDDIKKWSSEEIIVPYFYDVDKKYHKYYIDLKIVKKSGEVLLIEIKPDSQTRKPNFPGRKTKKYLNESLTYIKNQNKWKAAKKYASERGWKFVIWTENELQAMGIMPKPLKKLKPLRKKKNGRNIK